MSGEVLSSKQTVLVQVAERAHLNERTSRLSSEISLAGRFMVLDALFRSGFNFSKN